MNLFDINVFLVSYYDSGTRVIESNLKEFGELIFRSFVNILIKIMHI